MKENTEKTKAPEKGFNLRVQECKEDIANAINKANLPAGVLLMIIGTFVTQLSAMDRQAIEAERMEFEEAKKEVKEDGKEIRKD